MKKRLLAGIIGIMAMVSVTGCGADRLFTDVRTSTQTVTIDGETYTHIKTEHVDSEGNVIKEEHVYEGTEEIK